MNPIIKDDQNQKLDFPYLLKNIEDSDMEKSFNYTQSDEEINEHNKNNKFPNDGDEANVSFKSNKIINFLLEDELNNLAIKNDNANPHELDLDDKFDIMDILKSDSKKSVDKNDDNNSENCEKILLYEISKFKKTPIEFLDTLQSELSVLVYSKDGSKFLQDLIPHLKLSCFTLIYNLVSLYYNI